MPKVDIGMIQQEWLSNLLSTVELVLDKKIEGEYALVNVPVAILKEGDKFVGTYTLEMSELLSAINKQEYDEEDFTNTHTVLLPNELEEE